VVRSDFLQADDVGIQLAQHIDDRVDADATILAAAPVNVPTDNTHTSPPENTTGRYCHSLRNDGHTVGSRRRGEFQQWGTKTSSDDLDIVQRPARPHVEAVVALWAASGLICRRMAPAKAIIAPLSVQNSSSG
jgi:hypothetical protein